MTVPEKKLDQNFIEFEVNLEEIRKKVKEGKASREEEFIDKETARKKTRETKKSQGLLAARKKIIENRKREREDLRERLEKSKDEEYSLICNQILNLGKEIKKLEDEIEVIPSDVTNIETDSEKQSKPEEKLESIQKELISAYKKDELGTENHSLINILNKLEVPENATANEKLNLLYERHEVLAKKYDSLSMDEKREWKYLEKLLIPMEKLTEEERCSRLEDMLNKETKEELESALLAPKSMSETSEAISATTEIPLMETSTTSETSPAAEASTSERTTSEIKPSTTAEVGVGVNENKEEMEKEIKELDDNFATEEARKKEIANFLRQEIINLIEKAEEYGTLGRDKGKIKELIENNEAVSRINNEIDKLKEEVGKEINIDALGRLKKKVLEKLLELEKEKTSLEKLGSNLEGVEAIEKIAEKVIGEPAKVVGKTVKSAGRVGGKAALWGVVFAGLLVKNSFKLAWAELKLIWETASEHIPGGKNFSRGWDLGRKTFADKEKKNKE